MEQENKSTIQEHHIYVKEDNRMRGCLKDILILIAVIFLIRVIIVVIALLWVNSKDHSIPIQYYQVESESAEATIHTGMSKDSVILLLGQPTEFDYNEYCDRITYRYGEYGFCKTEIVFEDGKVSCVSKRGTDIGKKIREASENLMNHD
jgi:signal peptidase I